MKKSILLLVIAMSMFVLNAFAELKEVRGVQTRSVSYVGYDSDSKQITRWGYELKNENNYPVWVELELKSHSFTYYDGYNDITVKEGVRDTKNITLQAGETYIWKCGDRVGFVYGWPSGSYHDHHDKFYVTYKAYKAE